MSVEELIKVLEKIPKHKIVVLIDSENIGWSNVGTVIEDVSTVKIYSDDNIFDK